MPVELHSSDGGSPKCIFIATNWSLKSILSIPARLIKRSILSSRLLEGVVCRLVKNTLDLSIGICFKLVVENVKSIVKTAMFDFPGRLFVSYIYCKNKEKL